MLLLLWDGLKNISYNPSLAPNAPHWKNVVFRSIHSFDYTVVAVTSLHSHSHTQKILRRTQKILQKRQSRRQTSNSVYMQICSNSQKHIHTNRHTHGHAHTNTSTHTKTFCTNGRKSMQLHPFRSIHITCICRHTHTHTTTHRDPHTTAHTITQPHTHILQKRQGESHTAATSSP